MTVAPSLPSTLFTVPYITVAEFKRAPTGVDIVGLSGTTTAERDAELTNVIARASGLVNTICRQNLAATTDVEQGRVRMNRDGEIFVQTHCWPVIEVNSLYLGATPSQMVSVDLTELFIQEGSFTVTQPSLALTTNQGPLQFAAISPTSRAFAKWTYVNGWPCTTATANAIAGATSITVADITGIHTGSKLTIYSDSTNETVTVTGEPSGHTVAITATVNAVTSGDTVTSLPPSIKQATISITSALIKLRGNQALVMRTISGEPTSQKEDSAGAADIRNAMFMLEPFRAVR